MKSLITQIAILLALTILSGQEAGAQLKSGTVTFEEKAKFEIKLSGEAAMLMKDMPTEMKSTKTLKFTAEASTYTGSPTTNEEITRIHEAEGITIVARASEPENIVHTDIKKKRITEMREFMTRKFLIESPFTNYDWKITGNQKEIAGFACMEAVRSDTAGIKTTVWFTPQIELPLGPALHNNLPGMILEVNENNGQRVITATEVSLSETGAVSIAKPSDGKKVSREEFDAIVREKMKEMNAEGSGNTMRVIIRNEQ
jgi:GLPGLI family protein